MQKLEVSTQIATFGVLDRLQFRSALTPGLLVGRPHGGVMFFLGLFSDISLNWECEQMYVPLDVQKLVDAA